jgi:hypothetical protein
MADLESMLIKNLHRAACPDPIVVGEYHLGTLKPERARQVQDHLAQCPYCCNEISILRNYLNLLHADLDLSHAPDGLAGLGDRIKIWIARLLPPLDFQMSAGQSLAFAVRGEQPGGLARYEIGNGVSKGELNLESQEDMAAPGRKILVGLVLGIATQGLQAALWQSGKLAAGGEVDEFGNLAIANLVSGSYDLILSTASYEIHVHSVQI